MADVEDEPVLGRVENAMQRDRELDHAEIGPEMSAGLGENLDQLVAHFLRELRQILFPERFDVRRRTNSIEQTLRRFLVSVVCGFSEESDFVICFRIRPLLSREEPLPAPAQILPPRLSRRCCG